MSGPVVALVGIDTDMYNPPCAYACNSAIASNMLSCSSEDEMGGDMDMGSAMTSPQCRAGDTAFLTTLAWCLHTKCAQYRVRTSKLEKFWEDQCTGDPTVAPKWDFSTALQHVAEPPTQELTMDDTLNFTAITPEATWELQYHTMTAFEAEETVHARYGYGQPIPRRICTERGNFNLSNQLASPSSLPASLYLSYSLVWGIFHT